jgi:glyoxylase-like metal-dependent hydrolase (beta-lactamase superfamily II)
MIPINKIHCLSIPVPYSMQTVNVYVVEGDCLTLIDTGTNTAESLEGLKLGLKELGYKISDIEQVILTHHHPDHSGLLEVFRDDAIIIGHERNIPYLIQEDSFLTSYVNFFTNLARKSGVPEEFIKQMPRYDHKIPYSSKRNLTHTVNEGDSLTSLEGFTVIYTPGHATSHIALYRESDGLLFGGDLLLEKISSNPLLEPPLNGEMHRPRPLPQYNQSLRRIASMPIQQIYTGHGKPVLDVQSLVEYRLEKQQLRANKVYDLLKESPLTAYEVCKEIFPKVYQRQLSLTMSETVGQLDFLEDLGKIKLEEREDGTLVYKPNEHSVSN